MSDQRRLMISMPPGAGVRMSATGSAFSLPLWLYWVEIARQQAAYSRKHRPSDETVDALSARLIGEARERPDEADKEARQETFAALVAVTAAACSLDAFYGSVKPLVNPPTSTAARERQILECLKLGFDVGRQAGR